MPEDEITKLRDVLEDIKGILLLTNQDKIDELKKKLLKSGSLEEKVYNMCADGTTNEEITSEIQKDGKYVNAVVSTLRQKGLIKTVEGNGKKVHMQRL